jgi:hypothetical protein
MTFTVEGNSIKKYCPNHQFSERGPSGKPAQITFEGNSESHRAA